MCFLNKSSFLIEIITLCPPESKEMFKPTSTWLPPLEVGENLRSPKAKKNFPIFQERRIPYNRTNAVSYGIYLHHKTIEFDSLEVDF